ncbi:hypothetical protein Tco_0277472 [Tanacetum coccineum]
MATLKFADSHNMVTFLSKPTECERFEQIVDFLNAHPIRYALTVNPTIYVSCIEQFWSSAMAKTINGEVQLHALVDGKMIVITETYCLSPKTTAWNEFSSTMASVIICLATNQKFNFSKLIFDSMSSGPTDHVADEVVYKERGNSLVRAATTTSSLEAKQDSGNIDKTQSKATLNEPSFPRTSLGSSPRGNTLRSGEDSLQLKELMELCTNLQQRVLDLEKTKTTQVEEIVSLKRRVKKLEQKKRSRTHMLKRLRKVGATARVESSGGEESLGEDTSKQGRIDVIDAYDYITMVSVHDVNVSTGKEEVVKVINTAKLIIDTAQVSAAGDKVSTVDAATTVSVATTTTATTVEEITLAQALTDLKSTKPKAKAIAFREPGESTTTTTPIPSKIQDKGKAKMIEPEPVKKLSKKDQLKLDEEIALKLQAEIDEEERIARAKEEKIDEANIAWDDIQAKVDADYQLAERLKHFADKRAEEKRNKPPTKTQQKKTMITYLKNMEGWKHKDLKDKDFDSIKELFDKGLKRVDDVQETAEVDDVQETTKVDDDQEAAKIKELIEIVPDKEEIIRADGSSKMYLVFSHMLKSFDREDLETLWKLVKAKHGSTRPEEGYERVLWDDLKTMFDPHVEDTVWRNQQDYRVLDWKIYDSCGVHSLRMQHMHIHMLVEKRYPLTPATITDMLNKKLQCDHFSEMAYQLLKLLTKQLKNQ